MPYRPRDLFRRPERHPVLPAVLVALPVAAALLWAVAAAPGSQRAEALTGLLLWAALSAGALLAGARLRWVAVGSLAAALSCWAAFTLGRAWWQSFPLDIHAMAGWLVRGLGALSLATAVLAAGGCLCGRLARGVPLRHTANPGHWLLGVALFGVVAIPIDTGATLAGPGWARGSAALLATAYGWFLTRWAARESDAAAPPARSWQLVRPLVLPRRKHRRQRPAAPPAPAPGHGRRPGPSRSRAGTPRRQAAPPPPQPSLGPRRGRRHKRWLPPGVGLPLRRPTLVVPNLRAVWHTLSHSTAEPGAGAIGAIRTTPARTQALRLVALYGYAGIASGSLALLALGGRQAGTLWLQPAAVRPGLAVVALVASLVAVGGSVLMALRSRLLHPLELVLPRPPLLLLGVFTAGAALLAWAGSAPTRGLAAGLLHVHAMVTLMLLDGLLLPTALVGLCFGLLQTRLDDLLPPWQAALVPAVVFALSGSLAHTPVPPFSLAVLLGLWLGWARRRTGAAGAAAALVVGNLVAFLLLPLAH